MNINPTTLYSRVVLKLSGEACSSAEHPNFDFNLIDDFVEQIYSLVQRQIEVVLVLGGGNLARGKSLIHQSIDRIAADQVGMFATLMNSIIFREKLLNRGVDCIVFSHPGIPGVIAQYDVSEARAALQSKKVVICGGGLGIPCFSTDSAAALRAIELQAHLLIKATKVDGIFDADPSLVPGAKLIHHMTHQEALDKRYCVLDLTAFDLCAQHHINIAVCNIFKQQSLLKLVSGEKEGTLVSVHP